MKEDVDYRPWIVNLSLRDRGDLGMDDFVVMRKDVINIGLIN